VDQYEILICPVCLTQIERDWETGADCYHRELGGNVEAVTVPASVLAKDLSDAVAAAQPKLKEEKEKEAKRRKEREAWEALPAEERERIKAEEWAKMSPMEKALRQQFQDLSRSTNRQLFGSFATIPVKET